VEINFCIVDIGTAIHPPPCLALPGMAVFRFCLQLLANGCILGKTATHKGDIMRIGINPWLDMVFKQLFGSEENKVLLFSLVNAVLEQAGEKLVVELELLNPYNAKKSSKDKLSIVDIKAKNEAGEWFLIEVQVEMYGYFLKRMLYYWARHYHSQLKESEEYDELKKVTVICFAVEKLPIQTPGYYNFFRVMEAHSHLLLADDLAIHTIELPKFMLSAPQIGNALERWTYFLKHGESLDDEKLPKTLETPEMTEAVKQLKKFSLDDHQREEYEVRLKAMRDHRSSMAAEFKKGIEKGEQIGIQKGRQEGEQLGIQKGEQIGIQKTVVNALKSGLDVETIHKITGVAKEEIRKLQNQANDH
jgi:predicted transposase/invertase (TIGR01784 family)